MASNPPTTGVNSPKSLACAKLAATGKACKVKTTRLDADGNPICHLHDANGKAAQVRLELREAAKAARASTGPVAADMAASDRLAVGVDEGASMLDLSTRTLRAMIASGELHAVRIRGRVLIPMHVLRQLVGLTKECA